VITDADWRRILSGLGVRPFTVEKWVSPFADEVQLEKFSAGEADLLDWLPQILHESAMLECVEERLTYNPERICAVWPSRFPTMASAIPYAHNPVKLANKVYASRMGNGDEASGNGYLYRGRGPIQLTGKDAYIHVGDLMGQDLQYIPELMAQPRYGLEAAIAWWESRIPDSMLSDQVKLRRRVNGGTLGLDHVTALREKMVEVLA
jgi:putative chitinase